MRKIFEWKPSQATVTTVWLWLFYSNHIIHSVLNFSKQIFYSVEYESHVYLWIKQKQHFLDFSHIPHRTQSIESLKLTYCKDKNWAFKSQYSFYTIVTASTQSQAALGITGPRINIHLDEKVPWYIGAETDRCQLSNKVRATETC